MCCFACTAAPGRERITAMQPARLTNHVCAQASDTERTARRERVVVDGRRGVRECGQCARRGACAGNGIEAEGAVALAAALKGNTTLQTLDLRSMWIARKRVVAGMGGRSGTSRVRERRVLCSARRARVRAADHGVLRGADNGIRWEGAAALAAALQGNTTLQTLDLRSMWTARKRVVAGMGSLGEVASSEQQGASGWWLWSARRARAQSVSTAWCVCRERHRSRGRCCAGGGAQRQHDAADARPPQYVDRSLRVFAGMGGRWVELASARAACVVVGAACASARS
jgi:hypothetical protein